MLQRLLPCLLLIAAACTSTKTFTSASGPIPPRSPGATYPNWEYYCAGVFGGVETEMNINEQLAKAGAEGWELVSVSDSVFCFKRPILPLPPAR